MFQFQATLNIAGNTINAQAIEHYILRRPTSSKKKEVNMTDENVCCIFIKLTHRFCLIGL